MASRSSVNWSARSSWSPSRRVRPWWGQMPGTVGLAMAVVAPGLMVMAVIMFMGKVSGAHLNPGCRWPLAPARGLPLGSGALLHRGPTAGCLSGSADADPTRGSLGDDQVPTPALRRRPSPRCSPKPAHVRTGERHLGPPPERRAWGSSPRPPSPPTSVSPDCGLRPVGPP